VTGDNCRLVWREVCLGGWSGQQCAPKIKGPAVVRGRESGTFVESDCDKLQPHFLNCSRSGRLYNKCY